MQAASHDVSNTDPWVAELHEEERWFAERSENAPPDDFASHIQRRSA